MPDLDRRGVIGAGIASAAMSSAATALPATPGQAGVEAYWRKVAAQYDVTREVVQLENGNWGMMARPVLAAYDRHTAMVNQRTSFYGRREFPADLERVRARAARSLGVATDEIAFTRGATEALQALVGGYNRLKPGDAVLYADLDYDSVQAAFRWLKLRRGVDVVAIDLPEPAAHQGLIDAYDRALTANPKVRLLLLTQVSHRTGLHLPVREIADLARARGVDVILDAAHAWGQLAFALPDLGCDYVGLNGHKWIGAPVGVGVLYIRKGRAADIDSFMGTQDYPAGDVRNAVHSGTANFAALLALEDALDFHERIGIQAKAARLRRLRDRWAEPLRDHAGLEILTPPDPRLTSAICSFRLRGETSAADNVALAKRLLTEFGIFTVHRTGLASGACVRVTPAVFTSEAEIDRLVAALKMIAA